MLSEYQLHIYLPIEQQELELCLISDSWLTRIVQTDISRCDNISLRLLSSRIQMCELLQFKMQMLRVYRSVRFLTPVVLRLFGLYALMVPQFHHEFRSTIHNFFFFIRRKSWQRRTQKRGRHTYVWGIKDSAQTWPRLHTPQYEHSSIWQLSAGLRWIKSP